jgi:thiosulfate/3-mercaptopyruvate sulfurtransferase
MRLAPTVILLASLSAPAFAQAQDVTPLVTAEWLKANAGSDDLVILDIRDKVAETDLGELPYVADAVVAPYATAGWRVEVDGVPAQIPPVEQIAALIGNLGIDGDDHVVIVPWGTDSTEFGGATRVYWTFKYLGHDAVSILDGGWRQYDAAGGERAASPRTPEPVTFTYAVREELRARTSSMSASPRARSSAPRARFRAR